MSERKITIKPYRGGSLGLRVFLISLALLILPLFVHTFLLYKKEYQEKLDDIRLTLRVIGEGQKALLEERIEIYSRILEAAGTNDSVLKQKFQIVSAPALQGDLATISKDGKWLVLGQMQKKIAIQMPLLEIFDLLTHFEDAPYPIFLAFVDPEGTILAGESQPNSLGVHLPIEGAAFSLLLTVPEKSIQALQLQKFFFRIGSFLFFIGLLGGLSVWTLMKRVSRPLQSLHSVMKRVAEGANHVRYKKDWLGFEINALGTLFNQTLDSLFFHMQEVEKQKLAREKLAEELRIGHEIQLSLLPSHLPDFSGIDLGFGFLPAREVGGDFYDIFPLKDGSLFIVIADTAGKGVSACLYSLGLRSILRSLTTSNFDLSEIILQANDLFLRDAKHSGMFVTLWAAIYDPLERALTYCSQGHPPAILIRRGKIEELWTAGIALGAQVLDVVTTKTIELAPQDLLVLYTDGVIEAQAEDQDLFGQKRLLELLIRSEKLPPPQIVEKLFAEIELFSQRVSQSDDIAVLSIKIV